MYKCFYIFISLQCYDSVIVAVLLLQSDEEENQRVQEFLQPRFIAHVPVPSQQEVEMALLARKKQELLDRYASSTLVQQSEEAKELLGVLPEH